MKSEITGKECWEKEIVMKAMAISTRHHYLTEKKLLSLSGQNQQMHSDIAKPVADRPCESLAPGGAWGGLRSGMK